MISSIVDRPRHKIPVCNLDCMIFILKDTQDVKTVEVIEMASWPWNQALPNTSSQLLTLVQTVLEKSQSNSSIFPITIVCW